MIQRRQTAAVSLAIVFIIAAPMGWARPASAAGAVPAAAPEARVASDRPAAWVRSTRSRGAVSPIRSGLFSHVALGVRVSPLGIGVEMATPLSQRFNLRAGVNFFHYTDNLTTSGVNYQARISFTSAQASLDWFPWGRSFHISPGALVYSNNRIAADGEVPGGDSFSVNNTDYVSSPSDPIRGSAHIAFAHVAPMVTAGWGNLIPRNGRRSSIPFEFGFAYVGDPKVSLNFAGTACDAGGLGCEPVSQDPSFQSNLNAEKAKLQKDANYARFFPILSIGYSYRF